MNKARIVLGAVALMAVAGGIFAFKAKEAAFAPVKTWYKTGVNGLCTSSFTSTYTTDPVDATTTFITSITTIRNPQAGCPANTVYLLPE
ncbi:hypothetical protein [Chitinophaga filiformis]|uniref:Secreted protein n=1 Tax=Chitinophaga filiformis TaxID=104663 RepID=A0ABY4I9Q8_CHIFI|nr:hypothetical protein [Chitinophaga filiformis]UPK71798.1 hypothetical protein MYF79_10945 [Chitinophaga filiformis]